MLVEVAEYKESAAVANSYIVFIVVLLSLSLSILFPKMFIKWIKRKMKMEENSKQIKYARVTDTGIFNLHLTKFIYNWMHKFGDVPIYLIYVFDWV